MATKVTDVVAQNEPVTTKSPELTNHFAFVIDRSGSMRSHASNAENVYTKQVAAIRAASKELGQKSTISLYMFNDYIEERVFAEPVERVRDLAPGFLSPRGDTAALDAVGKCLTNLSRLSDADNKTTSFLVTVLTDGEDNSSTEFKHTLAGLIQNKQATDRWTIVFSVPNETYKQKLVTRFGIPAGNIQVWDTRDLKSVERIATLSVDSTSNYMYARSRGITSVKSYFETDLSKVTPQDLSKLSDLSNRFKPFEIEKEAVIKDFIEEKTARPYRVGCAFYELMKPEDVQAHKNILIREKNKRNAPVYGGTEARSLLGLPAWGTVHVTPGNHMTYKVYVQSTSLNRKLPRGTSLLYEV